MRPRLFLFALLTFGLFVASAITSAQRRTELDKPIMGDFKITVKSTVAGQSTQSTTMIKGQRERSETSMDAGAYSMSTVSITQCDMKRTIQINDRARKYLITPMDDGSSSDNTSLAVRPTSAASTRGGVVTMTVNTVDTGEPKEMFGFTARHLKRTTMMQSSPDACYQQNMKIETDGWYINLEYGLSCPANRPSKTSAASALTADGIDAIALNAISPSEAVAEAQAKQCTYILYTDLATLKSPWTGKKIGGLLGRATGVGSNESAQAEAGLDFRLLPTGSSSATVQSSASAKEETTEASVNAAIRDEARAVVNAIPRL